MSYLCNGIHGEAYQSASQMSLKMNELDIKAEKAHKKLDHLKKFHSIASEVSLFNWIDFADVLIVM